ncbi:hypothetical protein QVD17_08513 [Tagetes erecta]|uniref:Reverse transcriptase zinc-binding domain-containing protein n=1 Tax=Tagetes erecta TaxID=13708 RepID=A0AAD8KY28_TARER|nr:hypothetical protein QVD17_08513 [Tagetes erecta]
MSYHIWSIVTHRKSLWVEWIYDHKLKGRSFWEVEPRLSMSWGWRKILQVRELIRPYIHQKIGDGKNTFIWSDNWCEYSPLSSFITKRDIYRAGFSTSDKVDELVNDRNWRWPAAWYDLFPVLINIPVPVICNNRRDVSVWHDIYGVEHKFSIHNVWETIRYRSTEVDWYNIVWFTHCIPRHAFHVWLVCRKKLNTQDKMRTWDMNMRFGKKSDNSPTWGILKGCGIIFTLKLKNSNGSSGASSSGTNHFEVLDSLGEDMGDGDEVESKNHRARIDVIMDGEGVVHEGGDVQKLFVNHDVNFLGCEGDVLLEPTPDLFSTRLDAIEAGSLPVKYLGVPLVSSRQDVIFCWAFATNSFGIIFYAYLPGFGFYSSG